MTRLLLTSILTALVANSADATTFVPVDFTELVDGARVVVYGRVVDVQALRTEDRRTVETHVTLEALEYFKGDLGHTPTFTVPGGQLGRYRTMLVGAPRFAVGDEVVLFLNSRGPALPWVSGLSQGVFRVIHRDGAAEPFVTPPPIEAGVTTGSAPRIIRGDPARQPLTLSAFGRAVRALVERAR